MVYTLLQLILMAAILIAGYVIIRKRSQDIVQRRATTVAFIVLAAFIAVYAVLVLTMQSWILLVVFFGVTILVPALVYFALLERGGSDERIGQDDDKRPL